MNIKFEKWHGTGNDFIMIHDPEAAFSTDKKTIEQLCDRRFGIGADGFIIIRQHPEYDFQMIYFNADGRESSMCGNGGRCAVAFAKKHGLHDGETKFLAIDGEHEGKIDDKGIALKMGKVNSVSSENGTYVLDTGSPHYVRFQFPSEGNGITEAAREIRYSDEFREEGINVNFVKLTGPNSIKVRTYERGVEDETYSCGTGVVASAISTYLHQPKSGKTTYEVETLGGHLQVKFDAVKRQTFENVWLIGPATFVFSGETEI